MGKNHHNNKLFFRLLILIAIILAGCKDGPFSTSEILVDVTGKVLHQNESGELIPVSDAQITTLEHSTSANSNSDGQFVLRDIKSGDVTFVVTHEDFFDLEVPMEIKKSGNISVDLIFPTNSGTVVVTGNVLYQDDYGELIPVSNALIELEDHGTSVYSDSEGQYMIENVKHGDVKFTVTHEKYVRLEITLDVKKLPVDSHDLVYPNDHLSSTLYGVVYDKRYAPRWMGDFYMYDKPVAGAHVYIGGELVAVTDQWGRISISGLRRAVHEINIERPGYVTETYEYSAGNIEIFAWQIPMTPIMEQYYAFDVGNYWVYRVYIQGDYFNSKYSSIGEYRWEVLNVYQADQETWVELQAEAEYDEYNFNSSTDSTIVRSESYKRTYKVKHDDWSYIIKSRPFNRGIYSQFTLSHSFIAGSPDEVTETKPKDYFPTASFDTRKVYRRGVGLIFREYKSRGGGSDEVEIWTLIDFGKR